MTTPNYIERVLTGLSEKSREELQSHLQYLDSIFELIERVPSPERESLLVDLILNQPEKHSSPEPLHSSP